MAILARRSWLGGGFNSLIPKLTEKSTETVPDSKPSDDSIHTEQMHFEYYKGVYAGKIKDYGNKLGIDEWMKREHYGASGSVITINHTEGDIFQISGKVNKKLASYYVSYQGKLHELGPKSAIYKTVKAYMKTGKKYPKNLLKVIKENY